MNEWLNDEIAGLDQAEADQRSREKRLSLIQQHTSRLWEDVKILIQDAVNKINGSEKLRKVTGELECQSGYTQQIVVIKALYPAVYMTVKVAPNTIDVHRKIVTNGTDRQSREEKEVLYVDLDENEHPFLKTKEGTALTLEEAVHFLFGYFLHPELIEAKPSKGPTFGRFRM